MSAALFAATAGLVTPAWAAPAAPRQAEPCPYASSSAMCACYVPSWRTVGGFPANFTVNTLGGSAELGRVYAGNTDRSASATREKMFSGRLVDSAWANVVDMTGNAVADILGTPDQARVKLWASGEYDRPVFGATAAGPTDFLNQGSLLYVTRLAAQAGTVFAATGQPAAKGVHAWNEAQGRWDRLGGGSIPTRAFWAFESGGGWLWLGTDGKGIWSSNDAGANWTQVPGGNSILQATVTALAIDPRNPNHMLIGLGPQVDLPTADPKYRGVRETRDGGQTWSNPVFENVDFIPAIVFSRSNPSRVFATAFGFGIRVSEDGGQTWSAPPSLIPPGAHRNRLYDLLTLVPEGRPECELLFVGGDGGVWVRNANSLSGYRAYLPFSQRNHWTLATPTAAHLDGHDRAFEHHPSARATAPAVRPALPPR